MNKPFACRFCGHDIDADHNTVVGCKNCSCAATPGEGRPRTDAELDAPVLDPNKVMSFYTLLKGKAFEAAICANCRGVIDFYPAGAAHRQEVWLHADTLNQYCPDRKAIPAIRIVPEERQKLNAHVEKRGK